MKAGPKERNKEEENTPPDQRKNLSAADMGRKIIGLLAGEVENKQRNKRDEHNEPARHANESLFLMPGEHFTKVHPSERVSREVFGIDCASGHFYSRNVIP